MCICMQDMKFLRSNLCPGGLSKGNDDDNDVKRRTVHDYIGSPK